MIRSGRISSQAKSSASRRLSSVASRSSASRSLVLGSSRSLLRQHLARFWYSTERVLELRTGLSKTEGQPKTLYDPSNEKENCGVGLIASLKSVPSRKIVQQADEMLVRMAHRGGCGCDPASGDGSGT